MINVLNKFTEDVIVIGLNGEVKFCNEKLLFKLGYKKSEIENSNLIKLLKDNIIYEKILSCKKDINLEEIEFYIYSKDAENIKYKASISLETWNEEKVIFIICKEIKDELYTKEDLESFIDNAPFMCAIKDLEGKYVLVNKLASQGFEEKSKNIIGKHDRDIFLMEDCEGTVEEEKQVIRTNKTIICEKYIEKKDGYKRWLKLFKMPITDKNGQVRYLGNISNDISLRKNIENNLDNCYEKSFKKLSKELFNLNEGELTDSYERLDRLQDSLVKGLNADGINVWIYYDDVEELISEFRSGVCHEVVGDKLNIKMDSDEFYYKMVSDNFEGIKPISERTNYSMINELIKCNIKYQGSYKISYNNKIVGVLSILYRESEPDFSHENFIKKICNEMGIIIKNQTLFNELRREFNRRIESEKELAEFLNIATDIMVVIDDEGKIVRINNEASNSLGWTIEELKKMRWQDMVDKEHLNVTYSSIDEAKSDPYVTKCITNRYINKSGDFLWLDWRYKYFKDNKLLVCTAKNITEEKKMEEQKELYEKSLQLESIKNEFFSNISHEFKTPLNIILATMQLINNGVENKKIAVKSDLDLKRYFNSIKQNSYRLLRLVNNLIDMTRIESGFYNINLENNNIVSIIEDITMSVAQFIEDKGITLVFDTEVEDEIIACDPDKIERIMLNLLSNAIKYTKSDGEIKVNLSINNNKVVVSVKDDGIGIPEEKVMTIFERFVQVDNQVTRKCQGSGIGLSLVKSLVELHDGFIRVNSEEGKGTEFIFELPIRKIESYNEIKTSENSISSRIEKCSIEFSDIYK